MVRLLFGENAVVVSTWFGILIEDIVSGVWFKSWLVILVLNHDFDDMFWILYTTSLTAVAQTQDSQQRLSHRWSDF